MKFSELPIEKTLQESIIDLNFKECTPIQERSIPLILEGKDISGLAQTGTGKTAAFLIPLMDRILKSKKTQSVPLPEENQNNRESSTFTDSIETESGPPSKDKEVQSEGRGSTLPFDNWQRNNFILVLVPTRELADQVYENVRKLGESSGFHSFAIYGGVGYEKQREAFQKGYEFIIATPGRLIDLYKEHVVDFKQVRAIVFDEADRMFDMGFKEEMKFILRRIPSNRQIMVFSATLNFDVLNTIYQFGAEPIEINISKDQAKASNVKDCIFHIAHDEKPGYLISILKKYNPRQAIIFTNFKNSVEGIANFLNSNGFPSVAISSLLTQAQRTRVLEQFKSDHPINILVATDVAARGLDVLGVDLVINYELPNDPETYVHRIGRTGRAQFEGLAFSLSSDLDIEALQRIESYLKVKLTIGWLEESEIIKNFSPWKVIQRERYHIHSEDRPTRAYGHSQSRSPRKSREHFRNRTTDHPKDTQNYNQNSKNKDFERENSSRPRHGKQTTKTAYRSKETGSSHSQSQQSSKRFHGSSHKTNRDRQYSKSVQGSSQDTQSKEFSNKNSMGIKNERKASSNVAPQVKKGSKLLGKVSGFFKDLFKKKLAQ